jgi:transcriptional regulator with XRE-family HTH domain
MSQTIDPSRLKELRKRSGLSQGALGQKVKKAAKDGEGIDKQTIYRIEAGHQQAVRTSTVEKLAAALGVLPAVLTGQAPLPESESEPARARPSTDDDYSINVPVDGAVRNAFSLVQMRYRVPIARIVELAPFLFVLAAEASLERRKAKLDELQLAFEKAHDLLANFPYLPNSLYRGGSEAFELIAESQSISNRDIWGDTLPNSIFVGCNAIEPDYDEKKHNPFVVYLKEAAPADAAVASIRGFDRSSSEFDVCREDALKLADGADDKEDLATSIVDGEIILHKMPRELLNDDAVDARIAWLREKRDAYCAAIDKIEKELLAETAP